MEGGGTLSLREEGPRVHLEAARPDDGRGLYKAWVRGRQGSLLLGTLVPEAGGLRLRRTVSRSSLEQAGRRGREAPGPQSPARSGCAGTPW